MAHAGSPLLDFNDITPTTQFWVYSVTVNNNGTPSDDSDDTITIGTLRYAWPTANQIVANSQSDGFKDDTLDNAVGYPGAPNFQIVYVADDHSGFVVRTGSDYYYYSNYPRSGTIPVGGGGLWDPSIVCLLRGTLVTTPDGDVPVEDLKIGDMVLTHSSGPMPITWIGRSSHTLAIGSRSREVAPIRFAAGSLGEELPREDLWVSPRHCMMVDGALIPAERLVNGVTITQPPVGGPVDYFQLELDKHECVLAAGTWSETFLDQGDRPRFHNAHEHDGVARGNTVPYMPIVENGAELARRIEPIHAAAGLIGKAGKPFFGHVDAASTTRVSGWAFDAENPTLPVILDVVLDGEVLASAVACDYRKDIQQCGHGLGMAGYFADLPEGRVRPEDVARLEVVRRADGRALDGVHKQAALAA